MQVTLTQVVTLEDMRVQEGKVYRKVLTFIGSTNLISKSVLGVLMMIQIALINQFIIINLASPVALFGTTL